MGLIKQNMYGSYTVENASSCSSDCLVLGHRSRTVGATCIKKNIFTNHKQDCSPSHINHK